MTTHRLCALAELSEAQPVQVTVGGVRIAAVRVGEEVFAIEDRCSHERSVALSEGEVDTVDCTIECMKHGSLFSLRTGEVLSMPATVNVATFPIVIGPDGYISVELPERSAPT